MARWLKRGMDAGAIKAADAAVRNTVEGILAQVEDKKDAAIRELSKKFDNWQPKDFRLAAAEVEKAISTSITSSLPRSRSATSRRSRRTRCQSRPSNTLSQRE